MHQAAEPKGAEEANGDSDKSQPHPSANDEHDDLGMPCAQRHTHANFMRALSYREGHDSVDSHRGEQQRNSRECTEQKLNVGVCCAVKPADGLKLLDGDTGAHCNCAAQAGVTATGSTAVRTTKATKGNPVCPSETYICGCTEPVR